MKNYYSKIRELEKELERNKKIYSKLCRQRENLNDRKGVVMLTECMDLKSEENRLKLGAISFNFDLTRENNIVCNGNNNKFYSKRRKVMMYCKVEKMIETMDKVVEKTLHLVTPDSLKYMDSDNLEMLQLCLQLTEESKEVVKTEAEQLDRIEKKLDKLLSATNKIGA